MNINKHSDTETDIINETITVTITHTVGDGDVTLDERREWARRLFQVPPYGLDDQEPNTDILTDMLTDLRHYCQAEGINFLQALYRANRHYLEETR